MLKYFLAILIILALFVVKYMKEKLSKDVFFILKTILIVLFVEVTVFNINSYRTDFGNLKCLNFYGNDLNENVIQKSNNSQYISLKDLNTEVKSIYLELKGLEEKEVVDYEIFYSDNTTSESRFLATKTYCQDVDKTKYSVISLSRKL